MTALFAGSFDPFTRGHAAVLEQALKVFERVIVGIGDNIDKPGLTSAFERCRAIEELYCDNPRVEVAVYHSLTGEFCKERGITVLVRSFRSGAEADSERQLAAANRMLYPELTTVLLPVPLEYSAISSSIVRDIVNHGGDASMMLPKK